MPFLLLFIAMLQQKSCEKSCCMRKLFCIPLLYVIIHYWYSENQTNIHFCCMLCKFSFSRSAASGTWSTKKANINWWYICKLPPGAIAVSMYAYFLTWRQYLLRQYVWHNIEFVVSKQYAGSLYLLEIFDIGQLIICKPWSCSRESETNK